MGARAGGARGGLPVPDGHESVAPHPLDEHVVLDRRALRRVAGHRSDERRAIVDRVNGLALRDQVRAHLDVVEPEVPGGRACGRNPEDEPVGTGVVRRLEEADELAAAVQRGGDHGDDRLIDGVVNPNRHVGGAANGARAQGKTRRRLVAELDRHHLRVLVVAFVDGKVHRHAGPSPVRCVLGQLVGPRPADDLASGVGPVEGQAGRGARPGLDRRQGMAGMSTTLDAAGVDIGAAERRADAEGGRRRHGRDVVRRAHGQARGQRARGREDEALADLEAVHLGGGEHGRRGDGHGEGDQVVGERPREQRRLGVAVRLVEEVDAAGAPSAGAGRAEERALAGLEELFVQGQMQIAEPVDVPASGEDEHVAVGAALRRDGGGVAEHDRDALGRGRAVDGDVGALPVVEADRGLGGGDGVRRDRAARGVDQLEDNVLGELELAARPRHLGVGAEVRGAVLHVVLCGALQEVSWIYNY